MRVTPASSAAWIVATDRVESGRPSIDIGMAPRPIALTCTSPMRRLCMTTSMIFTCGPRARSPATSLDPPGPYRQTAESAETKQVVCSIVELRHLEYSVAVAEERHFPRAAERMHVAQSGLSASIRALERELGADLFIRSTRRVDLTEAGRALLLEAHRTLASASAAREAVAAVQGLLRGTLAVGAEQCLGVVSLPPLLARFRRAHPGVEIRLRHCGSTQLAEQIRTGRLDVAFVALPGRPPDGVSLLPLATEPMMLLCHPEHRLAARESVDWAALRDETFVDFSPDWGARQVSDRAFASAGLD